MKTKVSLINITFIMFLIIPSFVWSIDISSGYYFSTSSRGHNPQVITAGNFNPQVYYYSGAHRRTYFLWMQKGGSGFSIENMIFYYDHDTEELSPSYGVSPGTQNATDVHAHGAVIVADDGHIIVIHEKLWNTSTSGHNSEFQIKRSVNPEDPSAGFTLVHETGSGNCYPHIWKTANGNLFVSSRYGSDYYYDHYRIKIYKSTDNGISWDTGTVVVNFGTAQNYWAYHQRIIQSDSKGINLFVNRCLRDPSYGYPDCYYLKSNDGITWTNIDSSFSKDVITQGSLTCTEMDNYFLIEHGPNTNDIRSIYSGCFSPSGNLYLLQVDSWRNNPNPLQWFLRYWENDAWQKVEIQRPNNVDIRCFNMYSYSDNEFDIWVGNPESGITEIQRWKTTDKGQTWNIVENITDSSSYDHSYSVITHNLPDSPFLAFSASYLINSNYADIFILARQNPICAVNEHPSQNFENSNIFLFQNSPNPFYSQTTITYSLSNLCNVSIKIYNINGELVEVLKDEELQNPGIHSIIWNAKDINSGVYFYNITAGDYSKTIKCSLLK